MTDRSDHIQEPFGVGPHDLPLEALGRALEQQLHLIFPYFHFRYASFPLFVDGLQILPPNDPRALGARGFEARPARSPWVITRVKILAVVRMGTKRFSRFR